MCVADGDGFDSDCTDIGAATINVRGKVIRWRPRASRRVDRLCEQVSALINYCPLSPTLHRTLGPHNALLAFVMG